MTTDTFATRFLCGVAALLLLPMIAFAQEGTIRGQVTDARNGDVLPGANVVIQDEDIGSATQSDGRYEIRGVPTGQQTIVVSFVGYERVERTVNVQAGETTVANFQLGPDFAGMDEVVVRAYGEQERAQLTGSITSVSAAEIEDIGSVDSPEQLLEGTAGVQVTTASGLAGQAINVTVRGASTINGSSQPLYVVDGTPVTSSTTGDGFGQATNALSSLNANDIQSIEVLKGPSASALYGSRAANGVVLIETKGGSATGETQVSASFQAGTVGPTEQFEDEFVSGPQWAELHQESVFNFVEFGGLVPGQFDSPQEWENALGTPLETALGFTGQPFPDPSEAQEFPWIEEAQQTGVTKSGNISIQGGDDDTQFFVSGTWTRDESFVRNNQFDRFSGRLNLTQDVKDWLRVGTNTSITKTQNFQSASDNLFAAPLTSSPLMPPIVPIRNEDGSFNLQNPWNNTPNIIFTSEVNDSDLRNWRILSTTFLEANPFQNIIDGNLTLRAEGGIDALIVDEFQRFDRREGDGSPTGFASQFAREQRRFNIRGTATYDRTFQNRHDVNFLFGTSFEDSRRNNVFASGENLPSNAFRNVAQAASPITTSSVVDRKDGLASFFTRLTYTLDGKYTIEGSYRRDGSSRFGDENEWGNFGSASFAYNLHREDFMQDYGWLSNLKLRGSFGFTGNNNLGGFFPQLTLFGGGADINEQPGVAPTQLGDPSLQWESKRTIEGGIDLGVFNDRAFLTVTYYTSNTDQLILDRQLAFNSGFGSITENAGELRTQGVELQLETENIVTENLRWSTTATASWQDEKVKELIGGQPIISGIQRAVEGESFLFNMPIFEGVEPETGLPLFRDADGGTTTSPGTADNFNVGNVLPSWTGSFTSTLNYDRSWGAFDVRTRFTYRLGNDVFNNTRQFLSSPVTFGLHKSLLDRWQEPGDQTDVPRITFGDQEAATQTSTRFLEDGGFVRLKNVTFGFTLPDNLTQQFGLDNLRVYFQGTNLWTWDQITVGDPEGSTGGAQSVLDRGELFFTPPQQRSFTGGVEMQF